MPKRQVFFSFHFSEDNWRASQVRNMGKVDDSSTFSDNDWEEVRLKTDKAIKEWINSQMKMRSCLVVLIGTHTSGRKWINYEIEKAYELSKGIVGIYINKLKDSSGKQSSKGHNPFYNLYTSDGKRLSQFITAYEPPSITSQGAYANIEDNMESLIENAIANKGTY